MKKTFKPVPNVDCLKYKGTPEKPDIKIFVSHRIDLDSVTIDNPLYIPVRCGATFDERTEEEIGGMLGDDTGDNISEKRDSFCELTVLYWAWKNVRADYYGLCHYRRYISFANQSYRPTQDKSGFVVDGVLSDKSIKKYCLGNEGIMRDEISKFDFITTPSEDVFYAWDGRHDSMYKLCQDRNRDFDMKGVDTLIDIINEKYPQYSEDTEEYFSGHYAKYYNCIIVKKQLFDELCSFVFDVLFELENRIDSTYYSMWKKRMPGFMAENLIGIFYLHLKRNRKIKMCEKDLIYFSDTERKEIKELSPAFQKNNIPIVFSSSDFFAPYAGVLVQSIVEHSSKDKNYDIIIFESQISKQNKKLLEGLGKEYNNISIRFYNPKPLIKNTKLFINSENQSEEAYYRILSPYILSKYDKAIVMDCDIVANTDIAKLFDENVDEYCIGAALDVVWQGWYNADKEIQKYCREILTLENPYNYVNTGVALFNLKKCRDLMDIDEMLEKAQEHKYKVQEQDILNLVYDGRIKFINISWNMYIQVAPHIKLTIDEYSPVESKKMYYKALETPFLIHWAAQPKPWVYPEMDYGYVWWQVASRTPFFGLIIARTMEIKLGQLHPAVYDLQCRMGLFDNRSPAKKALDTKYPIGSKKRKILEAFCPYGSRRWKMAKKLYYFFHPSQKPQQ